VTHSKEDLQKFAEQVEAHDRAAAFEIGFAKAAHDAGLTEEEYNTLRKLAIEKLTKAAQTMTDAPVVHQDKVKAPEEGGATAPKVSKLAEVLAKLATYKTPKGELGAVKTEGPERTEKKPKEPAKAAEPVATDMTAKGGKSCK
jgi:hypothetical protein